MYEEHFHLRRSPFDHTPDPRFLVGTRRHNEALATLYYGVRQRKGIIALTGEVGTGKTMLLRCLLHLLRDSQDIECAYLFTPPQTRAEFLEAVMLSIGLPMEGRSLAEIQHELCRFLLSRREHECITVLIIDETHLLSHEVLEEVRLLSNYETNSEKLLQIVLSGQPELDELLDAKELRQLKQRIALRARLGSLTLDETRQYVASRIQAARDEAAGPAVFPDETIAAIFRYSRGLPRVINTLCENSLISAFALQLDTVSPELVAEVARDFRLDDVIAPLVERPMIATERGSLRAASVLVGRYSTTLRQMRAETEVEASNPLHTVHDEPSL